MPNALIAHFKVEVGTCAVACVAHSTDLLTLAHILAHAYIGAAQVSVECLEAIAMVHNDVQAIARAPTARDLDDIATVGRFHAVAHPTGNVDATMTIPVVLRQLTCY